MAQFELNDWFMIFMALGSAIVYVIKEISKGKTERTKIENPQPAPEEKMTIANALDLVKDVLSKFASSLLSTYLGEPLIKKAQEKELLASETIPGITSKALEEIGLIMSELQLEINMMKHDLIKQVHGLTFNNGEKDIVELEDISP